MNFIPFLIPVIITFVFAQTPGVRPRCSTNEIYSNCFNSCSEKKCPLRNTLPVVCPKNCYRGCSCRQGYVRNTNGRCVLPRQCPPVDPCSTVRCRSGYVCQVVGGRPTCVRSQPQLTCATVLCISGTFCYMIRSVSCNSPSCETPSCIAYNPCAATTCLTGSNCILRQVQCIRAPCPPIAECVRF